MDVDPPDKLWNYQDLRNASTMWSMKGDKALLDILQNIHNNVLFKATNTTEKLNTLLEDISNASLSLRNVNNKFTSLGNTQFIENKVQEDDENVKKLNENSKHNSEISGALNINNKELQNIQVDNPNTLDTIIMSLDKMESLCEKFDISTDTDSGSDDSDFNDINSNVILRPKDTYINKPLPYIIGSDKWQKNWHLGLLECTSDSDSYDEPVSKKEDLDYSSSDEFNKVSMSGNSDIISKKKNQMTLPIPKHNLDPNEFSAASSSTNNSTDTADSEVAKINALNKDSTKDPLNTTNKLNEKDSIPPPQTLVKASDFAAELAKKLGGNIHQEPVILHTPPVLPSKNLTKNSFAPVLPIESTNRVTGNIFSDEPPPVDTQNFNKDRPHDNFLSDNENDDDISNELFGDEPSSIFHSASPNNLFNSHNLFKSKTTTKGKGLFDNNQKQDTEKAVIENKRHSGLFDDIDSDDDLNIFNTKPSNKNTPKTQSISEKKQTSLPEKNKGESNKGTKSSSLFDDLETSDDDLFGSSNYFNKFKTKKEEASKQNNISTNNQVKSLFDDISDSDDDLFKTTTLKVLEEKKNTNQSKLNVKDSIKVDEVSDLKAGDKSEIFEDKINTLKKHNVSKDDVKVTSKESTSINPDSTISNDVTFDVPPPLDESISGVKETRKIFDDYDDDDDDLFGTNKKNNHDEIFSSKYEYSNKNISIFSDEPPDFDEQNDNKANSDLLTNQNPLKLDEAFKKGEVLSNVKNDEEENIFTKNKTSVDESDNFSNVLQKKENLLNSVDDLFEDKNRNDISTQGVLPKPLSEKPNKTNSFTVNFPSEKDKDFSKSQNVSENDTPKKDYNTSISPIKPKVYDHLISGKSEIVKPNEESQNITQKSIKKIQTNVNINVKALIPTSMPKSVKEIKSTKVEVDPPVNPVLESVQNELKSEKKSDIPENTLCNDILKDRVKIKVKRRPSSRKARHEAVRKSAADIYNFQDTTDYSGDYENFKSLPNSPEKTSTDNSIIENENVVIEDSTNFKGEKINESINKEENVFLSSASNIPSLPSIENNLFNVDDETSDLFDKKVTVQKKNKNGLFEEKPESKVTKKSDGLFDDSDSDSDLFFTIPKKNINVNAQNSDSKKDPLKEETNVTKEKKSAYESIFDESEDDDLFTAKKISSVVVNKNNAHRGLFDDDDNDETDDFDLFKTRKEITPKKHSSLTSDSDTSKRPKDKSVKPDNDATFQDPLSMFLNE